MGKTTIASGYILDVSGNATINGNIVLSSSVSNFLVVWYTFNSILGRAGRGRASRGGLITSFNMYIHEVNFLNIINK
jgi:hypothetical protein